MALFQMMRREDADKAEYAQVMEFAASLRSYMELSETVERIEHANVIGIESKEIQKCILDEALKLGFQSEREGLFGGARLRPDYFLQLSPRRGILLEVEKGKTLTNNMDMLDLWKCHICDHAQYLFLVVPQRAQNAGPRNVFNNVIKRMEPFFSRRESYVNVFGIAVFGY